MYINFDAAAVFLVVAVVIVVIELTLNYNPVPNKAIQNLTV